MRAVFLLHTKRIFFFICICCCLVLPSVVSADITTGLIGHWKFEEGSGTAVADSSGNSNNGTLVNGPTWTTGHVVGRAGTRALQFDGSNDRVTLTSLDQLDNVSGLTVTAWVKRATSTKAMGIVHHNGSGANNFELTYLANSKYQFRVYADTSPIISSQTVYYSVGEWELVVGKYDGSYVGVGVNKSPWATTTLVGNIDNNPSVSAEIGRGVVYGGFFEGAIGDVRIYNRALSNDDIEELYDLYAPAITNVSAVATTTGARITWNTNEAADSQVNYGLTSSYTASTTRDTSTTTSHVAYISGLSSNTTYHYQIGSADIVGHYATSSDYTFTTASVADSTAPSISSISTSSSATTATITWTTNEATDAQVNYGLASSYTATTTLTDLSAETAHSVTITGLTANTTYHFRVRSTDPSNNLTVSEDYTFTTESSPGSSITLSTPKSFQVFQRDSDDEGDISISGTYVGSPTAIEASWNGSTYTTIDSSLSGGTFSGTLSNMDAGQGTLTVRFANNLSVTDSTSSVGIGDIYVVAGQSNAMGIGVIPQLYSHQTLKASLFGNDDNWKELIDPTDTMVNQIDSAHNDTAAGGSGWPLLATHIMADQNVPVAFITAARDASRISSWSRSLATTTLYGSMYRRVQAAGPIKAVLWFQGESDAVDALASSTYLTSLTTLANNVNSDFGVKLVVGQIGNQAVTAATTSINNIRVAQIAAWDAGGNVLPGPAYPDVNLGITLGDNIHFKLNISLKTFAERWWVALKKNFYDGTDGRGPRLSSLNFGSTRSTIIATFTDESLPLLPSSGTIGGFTASSSGNGVLTISTSTRTASNQITLQLSTVPTGTVYVSLASGRNGIWGTMPYDSSANALPAEVFIDETVSANNTAPVISSVASTTSTSSAIITWTTDEAATSTVNYGATTSYGSASSSSATTTSHSITITDLTPSTTYHFQIASGDQDYNQATSADYTFRTEALPDAGAPTVSLTSPSHNETVSGTITISADASDDVSVVGVQFKVDTNTLIGAEDTSSAYSVSWNTTGIADGSHTLIAVARDGAGNYATSSSRTVTVDNTAPVLSAGSPSGTLEINSTSTTISATTNESATCKYSTSSGSAYGSMTTLETTGGTSHSSIVSGLQNATSYTYYVKCRDEEGNTNASDYSISFSVAADASSPTVSITSPANNASVSGQVTITASASDDVSVAGVQFKRNTNTLIDAEDTSSPYTITWDSTAVSDGLHNLIAVARDDSGNYATSSTVSVTVDNTGPVISSISSDANTTSVTITWTTDEASDSQVNYGPTSTYTASSSVNSTLTTSHSVTISSLSANTTYHFRVRSTDAIGNLSVSSDQTVTTDAEQVEEEEEDEEEEERSGGGGGGRRVSRTVSTPVITPTVSIPTPVTPTITTEPTPTTNTSAPFSHLTFGTKGPEILILQKFLNTKGFIIASEGPGSPGNETTYFGPATLKALTAFQAANNLPQSTPPSAPISNTTSERNLQLGMIGEDIRELQKFLNSKGYIVAQTGGGSPGKETTFFGYGTRAAVLQFQKAHGIAQVGYVGPITRAKIKQLQGQ